MDINNFGKTVWQKVGILNSGVVSYLARLVFLHYLV